VSGKDLKAKYNNSIIYILNGETLIFEKVANTSTLDNNTSYYYLEAAD
jgi:hypothetical protein